MVSDLTPVRTGLSYTIMVQETGGWAPVQHYRNLDNALEDLAVMIQNNQRDAFRVIEREHYSNGFRTNVIAEHYPGGYVYGHVIGYVHGPVKEPTSWLEEGF